MTPESIAAAGPSPSSPANQGAAEVDADAPASALTSDFETFLNLLTAQLKNQDPLNPMESTEFVAQIAQFSSVEQQVKTNDALTRIEASLNGGGGLTQWLGAEVEAAAALRFDGSPVSLRYDADPEAAQATLSVVDEDGALVSLSAIQPGQSRIEWDGKRSNGDAASEGFYRFSVIQSDADGEQTTEDARGFAAVVETRLGDSGDVDLILEGGDQVSASTVVAARQAPEE